MRAKATHSGSCPQPRDHRTGSTSSSARVNNAHDRLCKKAQADGVALDFVLYDLRHTFATPMAQEGIDLATLAKILGHNSIRIVERYVHPTDEHKKSAMERYEASQMALAQQTGQDERPN